MSRSLFWLSDEAWAAIDTLLPKNQSGARRLVDRRVIFGIVHMLKCGGRWADCLSEYGPATTVYNRWNRWSHRGCLIPWLDGIPRLAAPLGWIDARFGIGMAGACWIGAFVLFVLAYGPALVQSRLGDPAR